MKVIVDLIRRRREYVKSWSLNHAWFSHLLATHWLCIVIMLIVVQITVEHEPVTRQQSIQTSDYDGELTQTPQFLILEKLKRAEKNSWRNTFT